LTTTSCDTVCANYWLSHDYLAAEHRFCAKCDEILLAAKHRAVKVELRCL